MQKLEDLQAKAPGDAPGPARRAPGRYSREQPTDELAKANGKRDVTGQINYTHIADLNTVSLFGQIQLPIFDRNQGEIARTQSVIAQAQEQEKAASEQVMTDVADAYEGLHTNDQVVQLYHRSGYLDEAQPGSRHYPVRLSARRCGSLLDYLDAERSSSRNAACPIVSPSPRICSRSNSFARPFGTRRPPAMRFRMNTQSKFGLSDSSRRLAPPLCAGWMWLRAGAAQTR